MINLKEEHSKFVKLYSFSSGATSPTNIKLVEEMISHLDEELFKNPNSKFLDPCAGTGTFGVVLYDKLLKYHDSKWILKNMIFMVDTSRVNCDLLKKLGFVNVYNDDFLNLKLNMKFDVIVGNPPYQDNTDTKGKTSATLWPRFIQNSFEENLNINGYLMFVSPYSWMSPGNQLIRNRTMPYYFLSNEFIYLNLDCKKYFKESSTFSYYLVKNINGYQESFNGNVTKITSNGVDFEYNFSENNFEFIPIPTNETLLNIVNKVLSKGGKIKLESSSKTRSDKKWVVKNKTKKHIYPIRHTNKETLYSSIKPDSFGIKKVIFNSTGNFNPTYDSGEFGTTQITRWVSVENENEGMFLIRYLESKIIKFVLSNCRWSGAASKLIFELLPKIDFSKNYTDEELYDIFGLSDLEKDYIRTYDI